jgi:MFS family permease
MHRHRVIFYGWIIVGTGIVSYALGYGSRYSFSVVFPYLLTEFQWPRDMTAAMLSIHLLVYGILAPVVGGLVDRIGPRKTMAFGTILISVGLALSGLGKVPWHFYLSFGVLTGAGLSFMGAVPFTAVLRNWFERKRGLAFSILFFGVGGSFACYPGVAFLINTVNWRNTFLIEAIIVSGCMLPLIILIVRYHPRDKGLFVDGVKGEEEVSSGRKTATSLVIDPAWAAVDWTLSKAVKTRRFWMLCLSTFCLWGITQHILVTHHIAFAMDIGYSGTYAASVLSLFGALFGLGSLVALLSDRIGRESTLTIGSVIGISGIILLMFVKDTTRPWMLYYYATTVGFGMGMTSPTIAASTTDIFQGPKVGAIIGFVWFSFAVGGAIGPWLGGWIFELTNSYRIAFIVATALYGAGCAAIWLAAPRKVRLVPGRVGRQSSSSNCKL